MIPTEPIGSIPRPPELIRAITQSGGDELALASLYDDAVRDTIRRFEATESPVLTDGEQRKYHNFGTYSVHGLPNTAPDGAAVDYAQLLPSLFELKAANFYVALAGERDRAHALKIIRRHMKPEQRVFVGVVAPIDPRIETPEEVRDRVLEAAQYIAVAQLGTPDDCGVAPFSDDESTSRDAAFAKIRARVLGTRLAGARLGSG